MSGTGDERQWFQAGVAGLIASLLILGPAVSFFGGHFPEPGDAPARVVELLRANRTSYLVGIFCEVVSLGVVLWFYAGLRSLLEPAGKALARLIFASALALSILIWVQDSVLAASARLADRGTRPEMVAAVREVGLLVAWSSGRIATAMLLVATAVAIVRTRVLPYHVASLAVGDGVVVAERGVDAPGEAHGLLLVQASLRNIRSTAWSGYPSAAASSGFSRQ